MRDEQELSAVAKLEKKNSSDYRTVLVDDGNLSSLSARLPLRSYVAEMWKYRKFTMLHARYKASADNDEMFLGKLWTLLEPILRIIMYGTIFGLLLNTSRGIENFLGYLILGLTFFSMISKGLGSGSGLIQRSRSLMRTFRFPRASLVVGESIRALISGLIPAILAIIAALLFQFEEPINLTILLIVPLTILINVFSLGLMFFTARITAFVPDAKKMVFFASRAWFYVSGIFFSVERYNSVPELQQIMLHNPAYIFLQAIRGAILYGEYPSINDWLTMLCWSVGTVLIGFIFFWRAEGRYVLSR